MFHIFYVNVKTVLDPELLSLSHDKNLLSAAL